MRIKVKYADPQFPRLEFIGGEKSDWIDVRAYSVKVNGNQRSWYNLTDIITGKDKMVVDYQKGDTILIDLGFSAEMTKGFEAHVLPRSSTFKNYGIIQTNGMGIIDESYCGNNDRWMISFFALKDGVIEQFDRVGQFRIMQKMTQTSEIKIEEVENLDNADRGGFGTSGNK